MSQPNWSKIDGSSNIAAISYIAGDPDADLGTLYIRFVYGGEYVYQAFPNQLATDFFEADSKGKFFHHNIRSSYEGEKFFSNEQQDRLEEDGKALRDDIEVLEDEGGPPLQTEGEEATMMISDEEIDALADELDLPEELAYSREEMEGSLADSTDDELLDEPTVKVLVLPDDEDKVFYHD